MRSADRQLRIPWPLEFAADNIQLVVDSHHQLEHPLFALEAGHDIPLRLAIGAIDGITPLHHRNNVVDWIRLGATLRGAGRHHTSGKNLDRVRTVAHMARLAILLDVPTAVLQHRVGHWGERKAGDFGSVFEASQSTDHGPLVRTSNGRTRSPRHTIFEFAGVIPLGDWNVIRGPQRRNANEQRVARTLDELLVTSDAFDNIPCIVRQCPFLKRHRIPLTNLYYPRWVMTKTYYTTKNIQNLLTSVLGLECSAKQARLLTRRHTFALIICALPGGRCQPRGCVRKND